jgi:hypothetical protein
MYALGVALITFACLFGGALLGMRLRRALPGHHVTDESAKLLERGLAVIGTMAGLVLGLLVSAATGAYSAQRSEVLDVSSKVVLLDRILKHYGPSAPAPRRASPSSALSIESGRESVRTLPSSIRPPWEARASSMRSRASRPGMKRSDHSSLRRLPWRWTSARSDG